CGGMVHIVQKPAHAIDVVDERKREWLELDGELQTESLCIFREVAHMLDGPFPLIGGGDDLLLPDILAQNEEHVPGLELMAQIEIALGSKHVKIAHRLVEVRDAEGATDYRDYRQIGCNARLANEPPLLRGDFERIGKNIDCVEADFLG